MKYARHPEQPVEKSMRFADGLISVQTTFPKAGMVAPQHSHAYSHLSVIAAGAVQVEIDGEFLGRFVAPATICIEANRKHLFHILADNTVVLCIHNSDRADAAGPAEPHHLTFAED